VATAALERHDPDDQATCRLIDSLAEQGRHTRLEVLLTEPPRSRGQIDAWRSQGLEVRIGPVPADPAPADLGRYSHVIATRSGLRSPLRRWIEATQPLAARVLFVSSLEFRQLDRLAPITPPDERAGLDLTRALVQENLRDLARWADAVWCQDRLDAVFLASWLPDPPIKPIPMAIERTGPAATWGDRGGVVIASLQGHDVLSGSEEAAVAAIEEVLPMLRARQPDLPGTLIAARPSPMLYDTATATGLTLLSEDHLESALAGARVAILASRFGTGQHQVIAGCLRTGTPFVATPESLGGFDLAALAESSVRTKAPALAARAWQLLCQQQEWDQAAHQGELVVADRYSLRARRVAVSEALSALGITPGRAVNIPRATPADRPGRVERTRGGSHPPLRPPGTVPPPPLEAPAPEGQAARYQLWTRRYGPTPSVLRTIKADAERIPDPPRFSVIMPVYNTDPQLLTAAWESVRSQVYPHWELCLANDGSDRPETVAILDSLAADIRVKRVDLPGQSGISGATNAALALATGDYVAFLDHDDLLKPHALAQMARWIGADPSLDVVYSDEDIIDQVGELRDPHLKPDWSPDQLLSQNYVCHLTVARRSLVEAVGGLRSQFDGSQDYDLILRLTEMTDRIGHIPEPLYSWRATPGSFADDEAAKPYAIPAGQRALCDAMQRRGCDAEVEVVASSGRYRVRYRLPGQPKVTIIVPTKDRSDLLRRCIDSVVERSTYTNYDIVIVDNHSTDADTLGYMAASPWRVIRYPHVFNYARMVNMAARLVECDALLFLNNDTEVITPDWIEALLEHAMRPEVGIVGPRLYFGDGSVQHEGIMVGTWGDWATNIDHCGYFFRGEIVRNTSAVTGACCMIRPSVYWRVGGADERLRVAYNDVDLCLRLRQAGYRVIYTPFAELYHHEGSTRRNYQHQQDGPLFGRRWNPRQILDPYYSPVFSDDRPFEIKV
jgi:GT2 family glycosyltransferase